MTSWTGPQRPVGPLPESSLYAQPRRGIRLEDCSFYHSMDLPGVGEVQGLWNLRPGVEDYLGRIAFDGQRVLEIGPASGFLTVQMEKRGGNVVAVELADETLWNYVPYPDNLAAPYEVELRTALDQMKNAFWLAHEAYGLKAKAVYANAYNLPDGIGEFDIAVLASVLLHCYAPLKMVEQCARRAKTIVITEPFFADLTGPVCRLHPSPDPAELGTWWHFSPEFFTQFLAVMGFTSLAVSRHEQLLTLRHINRFETIQMFTVVGSR